MRECFSPYKATEKGVLKVATSVARWLTDACQRACQVTENVTMWILQLLWQINSLPFLSLYNYI